MSTIEIQRSEKLTYSTQEVADLMGVDYKTIRRAMENGDIPFIKLGRLRRVPKPALWRMLGMEEGAAVGI